MTGNNRLISPEEFAYLFLGKPDSLTICADIETHIGTVLEDNDAVYLSLVGYRFLHY